MSRATLTLFLAGLLGSVSGCSLCDYMQSCRRPHQDRERAGYPDEVSDCAAPSDTGAYVGYQVGGGATCQGDGPCIEDGTWGWDYEGRWLPSKVILGWWHGRREQGGEGAYKPDGPRVLETIRDRHE